jgi:DNA (cytosine-5)-methyltransferase 1
MTDKSPLLLDAFSCAGLGADGYVAAGFDVVCLDQDPKALLHNPHKQELGDALKLLADKKFMAQFDAVHASPPCQGYSATRMLANAQGRGQGRAINLLEPVRDLLNRWGGPWIIENVPRSPVKDWAGVVQLCGSSWDLKVKRHRLFAPSKGLILLGSKCDHSKFEIDPKSGKPRPWGVYYAKGDNIP